MKKVKCKCGADIVFAKSPTGKSIPLDPRPACYQVRELPDGTVKCERDPKAMVIHFATCKHASEFSGGRKT